LDSVYARRVCELIAGILLTDGEFHPSENDLLVRMFQGFGIPMEREVVLSPTLTGTAAAKAISELPDEVQQAALELLIDAAIADGKVVPTEQQYLEEVAEAMDITKEQLEEKITDRLLKM